MRPDFADAILPKPEKVRQISPASERGAGAASFRYGGIIPEHPGGIIP